MARVSLEVELEQLARAILKLSKKERQQLLSLLATLEGSQDPGALEALRGSEEDVREGCLYSFEEVFGEPLE